MARPTKLTKELRDQLCDLLEAGSFVEPAVKACGIALSTHYDWMTKAERLGPNVNVSALRGERLKVALQRAGVSQAGTVAQRRARLRDLQLYRERVEESLAESEAKAVKVIEAAAAGGDWRAASWYLERAHPERWGKRPPARRQPPDPDPPEDPEYEDPEGPVGDQDGL